MLTLSIVTLCKTEKEKGNCLLNLSLLNLRALSALMPFVPRVLHALVPHASCTLRAPVLHVSHVLHALVLYVLSCLTCLVSYVLSCLTCLVPYLPRFSRAYVSCAICAVMSHVPRALHVFVSHMSCMLFCLTCLVPSVFLDYSCLEFYMLLYFSSLTCCRCFKPNMSCIFHPLCLLCFSCF